MASGKNAWKLEKIYTNGWQTWLRALSHFADFPLHARVVSGGARGFLPFCASLHSTPLNSTQLRFALCHLACICWNHSLEKVLAAAHLKFILFLFSTIPRPGRTLCIGIPSNTVPFCFSRFFCAFCQLLCKFCFKTLLKSCRACISRAEHSRGKGCQRKRTNGSAISKRWK